MCLVLADKPFSFDITFSIDVEWNPGHRSDILESWSTRFDGKFKERFCSDWRILTIACLYWSMPDSMAIIQIGMSWYKEKTPIEREKEI